MISRRTMLAGLAGLSAPAMVGCSSRRSAAPSVSSFAPPAPRPRSGLDAVIDISHMVEVDDFNQIRRDSNILGVIHKATEGGDWVDASYSKRRPQAEAAGLLWGAYHFGTHQYPGARQAEAFLAVARPGPSTVMALDFEPNDYNPRNTMSLAQAEAFVHTIYRATGRLPLVYTRPSWANGEPHGRLRLSRPVSASSILAQCDLWLADYREEPEIPMAWSNRGWRLWQYAGDETVADAAYGTVSRAVAGVDHCDRNLFAGNTSALYRFWNGAAA